jgi:hypothetical protein
MRLRSTEVFDSQGWLNISSDGILEFLDTDFYITESVRIWALITWGKFRLLKQDQYANLRSQILPGLGKIRFDIMNPKEIADLFKETDLGEVLTADEKSSIFIANITEDWKSMPANIFSPTKPVPRHNNNNTFASKNSMYFPRRYTKKVYAKFFLRRKRLANLSKYCKCQRLHKK